MKISFTNIEHIFKLLTTTDWIHKYNPLNKLKKFEYDLSNETNSEKKEKLKKIISNITRNVEQNPYEPTLDHAGISQNEAQILLANLHLLYDNDLDYKKESQETLIQMLRKNFNQLNTKDIYKYVIKLQSCCFNLQDMPERLCNADLYNQILPYTKVLSQLYHYNGGIDPKKVAQKLSTYFINYQDTINYLKSVDYTTRETVLLSFQYQIPTNLKFTTLKFFQKLHSYAHKIGRGILSLSQYANILENEEEFHALINNKQNQALLEYNVKNIKYVREIVEKLKSQVLKTVYYYDENKLPQNILPYVRELAQISLNVKLEKNAFLKALNFIKENNLKKTDEMPDINFNFVIKGKEYSFKKLPFNDMRGFVLGKLSNSCQSIGDHAEKVSLEGMSKSKAGFYIITESENDKIRAQSYAWLAESEGKKLLILDSFEYLGIEDAQLFIPTMNKLQEALSQNSVDNIYKFYVGTGGKTPKLKLEVIQRPEPIDKELYLYYDSVRVYDINQKLCAVQLKDLPIGMTVATFEELVNANIIIKVKKFLNHFPQDHLNILQNLKGIEDLCRTIELRSLVRLHEKHSHFISLWSKYYQDIQSLEKVGINKYWLIELYKKDIISWNIFINSTLNIRILHDNGISNKTLLKMYEDNQKVAEVLIQNPFNFLDIKKSFNLDIKKLEKLSLKNLNETISIIKFGINIEELPQFKIGIDNLSDLASKYPVLTDKLASNFDIFKFLFVNKITLHSITEIYEKDAELINFIIKKINFIKKLSAVGIPVNKIIETFKEDPYVGKLLIANGEDIICMIRQREINVKTLLNINTKQLKSLLDGDMSSKDFKNKLHSISLFRLSKKNISRN